MTKTKYTQKIENTLYNQLTGADTIIDDLVLRNIQLIEQINPTTPISRLDSYMVHINTIDSVMELKNTLRIIKTILSEVLKPKQEVVQRNSNSSRGLNREKLIHALSSLVDNKNTFKRVFLMISLLMNSKDTIFTKLTNLSTQSSLNKYLKRRLPLFDNKSETLESLYPYPGGKKKFKKYQQTIMEEFQKNSTLTRYVDPFMGGIGSFISLKEQIKKEEMEVILNDLNPHIYNLNLMVKQKPNQMISELSEIIREMFITNGSDLTIDKYKNTFKILLAELRELEKENKKETRVRRSTILLLLMNWSFGGNYEVKDGVSTLSFSNDKNKWMRFLNLPHKIKLYNKIYRENNVKFENKDYKDILKKYDTSESLVLFDPPYLEYVPEEECETQNSCVMNYGFNDFPHDQLLKDIEGIKGKFIYFNNKHPLVKKHSDYNGFTIEEIKRTSNNGLTKKGIKNKVVIEYIMSSKVHTLSPKLQPTPVNNIVTQPLKKVS